METSKGSITSVKPFWSLIKTLDRLKMFDLGVMQPLQWLRCRLCELVEEHGNNFDVVRIMETFANDTKFVALQARKSQKTDGYLPVQGIGNPEPHPEEDTQESLEVSTSKRKDVSKDIEGSQLELRASRPYGMISNRPLTGVGDETDRFVKRLKVAESTQQNQHADPPGSPVLGSLPQTEVFKLDFVKTKMHTSCNGSLQRWLWTSQTRTFVHHYRPNSVDDWQSYPSSVNFDLHIGQIKQLGVTILSNRLLIVLKDEDCRAGSGRRRMVIYVSFMGRKPVKRFLNLCRSEDIQTFDISR